MTGVQISQCAKVPNKRGATFINFRKIFQGLHSYLEGVRLLVLTNCFLQVRKVGFKIPNSMKFILFEEGGYSYLRGVCLLFLPKFPGGTFIWGATLIRNSRVSEYSSLSNKRAAQLINFWKNSGQSIFIFTLLYYLLH